MGLLLRHAELHNQLIRSTGCVQPGTINWNPGTLTRLFANAPPPPQDGVKFERVSIHPEPVINVVCRGQPKPDMFAPGRDVIVEGRLTSRNFLDADQVLTNVHRSIGQKRQPEADGTDRTVGTAFSTCS